MTIYNQKALQIYCIIFNISQKTTLVNLIQLGIQIKQQPK